MGINDPVTIWTDVKVASVADSEGVWEVEFDPDYSMFMMHGYVAGPSIGTGIPLAGLKTGDHLKITFEFTPG